MRSSKFKFIYDIELPIKEKISKIATEIYGAKDVRYIGSAERDIKAIEKAGLDRLPLCIAKTQLSLTDRSSPQGCSTVMDVDSAGSDSLCRGWFHRTHLRRYDADPWSAVSASRRAYRYHR